MAEQPLQKTLYQALAGGPLSQFDLSRFIADQSIDRTQAESAAAGVFLRYCVHFASDGVLDERESKQLQQLAKVLEIPDAKRETLVTTAKERVYKQEEEKAQEDLIVTVEEKEDLARLRESLGLAPAEVAIPSHPAKSAGLGAAAGNVGTVDVVSGVSVDSLPIRNLSRTLKCRWECPPDVLRSRLAAVKALDRDFEKRESFWTKMTWGVGAAAVLMFLLFFVTENSGLLGIFAACLVLAVVSRVMKSLRGRLNIDDRRYVIADELLRHLKRDMPKEQPAELSLDFNNYRQHTYRTDPGRRSSLFGGVREEAYSLPWLSLKGRFVDGTRFNLSITQTVKIKKKPKRKYTKVKEAFREKVALTLQVRPKYAAALEPFPGILKSIRLNDLTLSEVRVDGTRVIVKAMTKSHQRVSGRGTTGQNAEQLTSNFHTHLQLLLACFDSLGRSRTAKGLG